MRNKVIYGRTRLKMTGMVFSPDCILHVFLSIQTLQQVLAEGAFASGDQNGGFFAIAHELVNTILIFSFPYSPGLL